MITSKDSYYDSCLRNGFLLPSKKSPFVTLSYLYKVVRKEYYCPKEGEVLRVNFPSVPAKPVILQEVNNILEP